MQIPLLSPLLPTGIQYAGPLMLFGEPQSASEVRDNAEAAPAASPKTPQGMHITRPIWADLSSDQQSTLAGLESVWPFISNAEKRRWLAIAEAARTMNEHERSRFSLNITNWAHFNEGQRQALRQQYRRWEESDIDELNQAWQSYRALAPDVRQQLASAAQKAAAPPSRPAVRRNNLVRIPAANQANPGVSNLPKIPLQPVEFTRPPAASAPASPNKPVEQAPRPLTEVTTVAVPETPPPPPVPQPSAPRTVYWYGIPITPPEPPSIYAD